MKLRHIIIIVIFVLINGLIMFALTRGKNEVKEASTEKTVVLQTLKAQKVKNTVEEFSITAYGEVSAYNSVNVSAEMQGKLQRGKIELKPGVRFRKGDLLFKIKDTEAIYNIRARKSNFINLIAAILPDIKADFPGEFNKWNDYISDIKLNKTLPILPAWQSEKEKVFLSSRTILSEYFSIKSAEEQLTKYYVYAPFSGTVQDVFVNEFSFVNPGVNVMTIVQTSNYEIPVAIPLANYDDVKIGTKVNIYTTTGTQKATGKVVRISDVLNKKTQSITAYVKPSVLDGKQIIEGEYLKVELLSGSASEGVRLPFQSVFDGQVYVYQPADSVLKIKPVSVLNENDRGVFIHGLEDNEIVITQEVFNYTDSTQYLTLLK